LNFIIAYITPICFKISVNGEIPYHIPGEFLFFVIMSAYSTSYIASPPTRRIPGSRWLDDLADIADALGIQEDKLKYKYALTELIEHLYTHGALIPEIEAVLSLCSWTPEETNAARVLEAYELQGEIFSQAPITAWCGEVPRNLAECVRGLAITIAWYGERRFHTRPSAWMWFPTMDDHVSLLAYVLMLYLYLHQHLPQERDPARKELMIQTYYNALEYLQIFRCRDCGGDRKEDGDSKSWSSADTEGLSRMSYTCEDLEEGEILEVPWVRPKYSNDVLPYAICTHRSGDPECKHFVSDYPDGFLDQYVDLSLYY
jgi:hypothetical protein